MEEMFEKIVTVITDVIGKETTNTTQLKRIGQQLFAPGFFLGVYPAKQKPQQTGNRGFYIVNEDDGAGTHWMGVAIEPGHPDLLFDSFGRRPNGIWQPWLQHFEITDQDAEQEDHETHCGQLTLAFGKLFELYGREAAEKI